MREYKALPQFHKAINGRVAAGVCAVFGNVDHGGDRLHAGAFAKTIREAGRRAKHLWNHSFYEPPIAVIRELREVGRDELPAEVFAYAPEATGGLLVTREYLDTPRGNEVLEGIRAGAINQMSFGYDAIKADYSKGEDGAAVRELREVRLWETSDCLWGMNEATVAAKSLQQWLERQFSVFSFQPSEAASRADAGVRSQVSGVGGQNPAPDTRHLTPLYSLTQRRGELDQLELMLIQTDVSGQ